MNPDFYLNLLHLFIPIKYEHYYDTATFFLGAKHLDFYIAVCFMRAIISMFTFAVMLREKAFDELIKKK